MLGIGVTLKGQTRPEVGYTFNLAASVTKDHVGAPMSVDTTAANTMKVAADGDIIRGVLFSFEDRSASGEGKVGTVRFRDTGVFPIKAADPLAVGDTCVGAGNGEVKKAAANNGSNFVVEITDGKAVVFFN